MGPSGRQDRARGVLVVVAPFVPYAGIDHAGGEFLRRYSEAAQRSGWRVRIIAPNTPANLKALSLGPTGDVEFWPDSRIFSGDVFRVLTTGMTSRTGRAWLRRQSPRALQWLREADVIDLQWSEGLWNVGAVRRLCRQCPTSPALIGLAHDLRRDILIGALSRGRPWARLGALAALPATMAREARTVRAVDSVRAFKLADVQRLRRWGASSALAPIPVTVGIPPPTYGAKRLLFVASYRRSENVEAAHWLVRHVLPHVRTVEPKVRLRLAGSSPPKSLLAYRSAAVEVTGYLEDVRDAYVGVSCVVVPLLRGAGVKFKTIDALRSGFPVVSTPVGAEGVEPGCVIVPEEPKAFARAILDSFGKHESVLPGHTGEGEFDAAVDAMLSEATTSPD